MGTGKRKKRPKGRNIYDVSTLLERQPKGLRKDPRYEQMLLSLRENPRILKLKFNRRCYSLLHDGVIREEHLQNFHRTYRLPPHPFFALFFSIKRDYLENREQAARDRTVYIKEKMEFLPEYVRESMNRMIRLEKRYRGTGSVPFFKASIYPRSKKKADQFARFDHSRWILFFETSLERLAEKYPDIPEMELDRIKAGLILQCSISDPLTGQERKDISRNYREFSKSYHPDTGGDSRFFIRLKWARDLLLDSIG